MVIDRDGKNFFRVVLTDNVVIEKFSYFVWFRNGRFDVIETFLLCLLLNNLITEFDTLITNIDHRTGNELFYFILTLPTERTIELDCPSVRLLNHSQNLFSSI